MSTVQLGLRPVPAATPALEAAVGSLPACFRLTAATTQPHAAWVVGGPGWAEDVEAALAAGALAVAVDTVGPLTPAEFGRFPGDRVLLVGTRTHAPQLRGLAAALPGIGEPELVDVLVVDGGPVAQEPDAVLWDGFAMLTAAGLGVTSVPRVSLGRRAVLAEAWIGHARAHLTCLHQPGAADRAVIKVFAAGGSVTASMGDPLVAAPGEVLTVTERDARLAATDYLTPRRVALAELHAAATGAAQLPGPLAGHARAADLISRVAWPARAKTTPTPIGRKK